MQKRIVIKEGDWTIKQVQKAQRSPYYVKLIKYADSKWMPSGIVRYYDEEHLIDYLHVIKANYYLLKERDNGKSI